ncbi:MAG: metallophosphoesterase family protein [Bryobacteraceae bacterium]|nr:metallophosphoesterase family protein [Bryobacteraceae bacterium]
MRYLILSDIHANRAALEAVLAKAKGSYDSILNCGDTVGYGPDPNYAAEFARAECLHVIRGNHDKAAVGLADLEWFNPMARTSAEWTQTELTRENAEWLENLPAGPLEVNGFSMVHGSPGDEDEYMVAAEDARAAAPDATTTVSFFGHTHVAGGFEIHRSGVRILKPDLVTVDDASLWLLNPGSVGQPRDGDPRAAWALFDSGSGVLSFHRAEYDISKTFRRILDAGLPDALGLRLYRGI